MSVEVRGRKLQVKLNFLEIVASVNQEITIIATLFYAKKENVEVKNIHLIMWYSTRIQFHRFEIYFNIILLKIKLIELNLNKVYNNK